jgi:hypothetical protein
VSFLRPTITSLFSLRPVAAAALAAVLGLASPAHATVATGAMTAARMYHQASTLPDGRVLMTGGYALPGTAPYASAELYDPASGVFAPAAPMAQARVQHAAVTLMDGRVLVMGGSIQTSPSLVGTASAELYDPATNQWTPTGSMNTPRSRATARLLPSGKVFVMNSDNYSNTYFAEVYDPQTGVFTKTGNVVELTGDHGLVVLADGRVMRIGGYGSGGYARSAEIWDPATNLWTATGQMSEARMDMRPVLLSNGKVLVAGGSNTMSALSSAELYDPATGLFSAASPMPEALKVDTVTALPNGNLVLTGPYAKNLMHYQLASGAWNATGPKRGTARATTVSALTDGKLLLAGGAALNDATNYAALWDPACAPQKIALLAATQAAPGNGGAATWTVTAAPGCRFEAADVPAWLTLPGGGALQMSESGSMAVSLTAAANATGAARSATFMLGNNIATVTQAASPTCPSLPTLAPIYTQRYYAMAGTLTVSAAATCPWSITQLPSWVTATSSTSGTGNGSVNYMTSANNGAARSGNGLLEALGGNVSFTMTQEAVSPCVGGIQLTNSNGTFPASGGSGSISVASAPTCPWTVTVPSFVTLTSGATGTGNGSFTFSVAANNDIARSGSGVVNGNGAASSFNLSQAASACAGWSISPSVSNFAAGASSGSFSVSAAASCSWSLGALPSWMTATGTTGVGNGIISYTVAANTGAARSATASMTGSGPARVLTLNQATGAIPTCASTPIAHGAVLSGALQTTSCTSGARGAGYYTDRYTFNGVPGQQVSMLLTSGAFDTYMYLRNPAGTVIKSDDDGGGGLNSRIPASSGTFVLPAGSSGIYTIEVTSYGSYKTGAYSLSFTQQ